jgi:hypothetical protein
MFSSVGSIVLLTLGAAVTLAVWLVWQHPHPDKTEQWPVTEGTIQSVGKVAVGGRGSTPIDVGNFSYIVRDEYYSGMLTISRSFSTHDGLPKDLISQNIQVRYNPGKPEKYSVLPTELGGFLLDPYYGPITDAAGPVDLNID